MNRVFASGERVLLLDNKQRRYLITLAEGAEFHSHAGFIPHADLIGAPRGDHRQEHQGRELHGSAPDAGGLRPRDASGCPGDLPQGPRPDLHARRHRAGGAGCSRAGSVRARSSMTMLRWGADIVGYEIREDFLNRATNQCAQLPRRAGARALRRFICATATRASRRAASIGSCSICPNRGRWYRTLSEALRPGGILVAYTPVDHPGGADPRGNGHQVVERHPHPRGAAPWAGTSKVRPCGPTTAWSPTPGFSTTGRLLG